MRSCFRLRLRRLRTRPSSVRRPSLYERTRSIALFIGLPFSSAGPPPRPRPRHGRESSRSPGEPPGDQSDRLHPSFNRTAKDLAKLLELKQFMGQNRHDGFVAGQDLGVDQKRDLAESIIVAGPGNRTIGVFPDSGSPSRLHAFSGEQILKTPVQLTRLRLEEHNISGNSHSISSGYPDRLAYRRPDSPGRGFSTRRHLPVGDRSDEVCWDGFGSGRRTGGGAV